jgi:hypothetical protein
MGTILRAFCPVTSSVSHMSRRFQNTTSVDFSPFFTVPSRFFAWLKVIQNGDAYGSMPSRNALTPR